MITLWPIIQGTKDYNVGGSIYVQPCGHSILDIEGDLDASELEEARRRARSSLFAKRVKEEYDYSCAVCGVRRFSPEGNPEVEAAHVLPKANGGPDELTNVLALCKFHHWAFDYGWIAISDERTVLINRDVG